MSLARKIERQRKNETKKKMDTARRAYLKTRREQAIQRTQEAMDRNVTVTVDGILQTPGVDYFINAEDEVQFINKPADGAEIKVVGLSD